MDAHRLIAEIKQRPSLWNAKDPQYKKRKTAIVMWQEVADAMDENVDNCKRKWKNLRDSYYAEVRRQEFRVENLADARCVVKWAYFQPLSFLSDSKRPISEEEQITTQVSAAAENYLGHIEVSDESSEEVHLQPTYEITLSGESSNEIKLEQYETQEFNIAQNAVDVETDALMQEFNCVATPQNERRFSDSHGLSNDFEANTGNNNDTTLGVAGGNNIVVNSAAASAPACKCAKLNDQWHFLEDLEREEQKLINSTHKDITRVAIIHPDHVGDADYNFLVSFLPHMKKMSIMQNLHFRSKMSELLLNTMKGDNGEG